MNRTRSVHSESVITTAFVRLRDDLTRGRFVAGEKLPGERDLAGLYGIGRSSMRQVLLRLQEERYIERRPMSGTYVREDVASRVDIISLAFVSPDVSFDPERIGLYSWGSVAEMLRGVYEESSRRPGIRITVLHCEDTSNPETLKHQMEDLRRFDGAIFCGYLMQGLKSLYASEGKPAVVVAPKVDVIPERFPVITYDYEISMQRLLSLIVACGKPVVLFCHTPHFVDHLEHERIMAYLTKRLEAHQVSWESVMVNRAELNGPEHLEDIAASCGDLRQFSGKVVWVLNRSLLHPVSYLLLKGGIQADLFGFSTSMVLQDFYPPIYYLLVPFCETGRLAVKMLAETIEKQEVQHNVSLQPVLYFGGRRVDDPSCGGATQA